MPLVSGTELGPYEILAAIGAGGTGEAYRARDRKLKRDLAAMVLPDEFSLDPERVPRFQREAQAPAPLNHSQIAFIYEIEETSSSRFPVSNSQWSSGGHAHATQSFFEKDDYYFPGVHYFGHHCSFAESGLWAGGRSNAFRDH